MKAQDFYNNINSLEYEYDCTGINIDHWERLMENHIRANHRIINQLVKIHLPELYANLSLDYYNPYHYFKTKTHLILVHSGIEYFLRIN